VSGELALKTISWSDREPHPRSAAAGIGICGGNRTVDNGANEMVIERFSRKPASKEQRTDNAGNEMRGILAAADFTLFLRAFDDLVKGSHVAGMHVSVE
jgi:hypothetical protein